MSRRIAFVGCLVVLGLLIYSCRHHHRPRRRPHHPECLHLDPGAGPSSGGTDVLVETRGFADDFMVDPPRVFFGGAEATSVTPVDSASVIAVTPPDPAPNPGGFHVVDVVVEAVNGQECIFSDGFKYEAPPRPHCLSLHPTVGPSSGGTPVVIETAGFADDFTVTPPRVFFGGAEATSVTAIDASTVEAITPPDPAPNPGGFHIVDVGVAASNGQECVFNDGFKYEAPHGPRCLTIDPSFGPMAGGTPVLIETAGFSDDFTVDLPRVLFGGVESPSVTAVDAASVIAETPPDPAPSPNGHVVDVVVEAVNGQECVFPDGFKYEHPPRPACLSMHPQGGDCHGGTPVIIETSGFSDDFTVDLPRVLFGGVEATSVTAIDASTVEAISPPYPNPSPGGRFTVNVVVEAVNGQECVFNDGFVYECPGGAQCLSIHPSGGPCDGGTTVTIETSGFSDDFTVDTPRVLFGGVEATSVTPLDPATVEAVSPPYPNPSPGGRFTVNVVVEAVNGQECVFPDGFVYECPTGCLSVEPAEGPLHGGNTVEIHSLGACLWGNNTWVKFGGKFATNIVIVSPTVLTCTVPPGDAPGPVDVAALGEDRAGNPCDCHQADGYTYQQ